MSRHVRLHGACSRLGFGFFCGEGIDGWVDGKGECLSDDCQRRVVLKEVMLDGGREALSVISSEVEVREGGTSSAVGVVREVRGSPTVPLRC